MLFFNHSSKLCLLNNILWLILINNTYIIQVALINADELSGSAISNEFYAGCMDNSSYKTCEPISSSYSTHEKLLNRCRDKMLTEKPPLDGIMEVD